LKIAEKLLVALATAGVISMGFIANTTLLNGVRTGEIARRYDLPFTPAGWTFSIWSFIYLALLAFTVYQAGRGAAASRVDAQEVELNRVTFGGRKSHIAGNT